MSITQLLTSPFDVAFTLNSSARRFDIRFSSTDGGYDSVKSGRLFLQQTASNRTLTSVTRTKTQKDIM